MDKIDPKNVRQAVFADGQWYPSTESELRQAVDGYLANAAREEVEGEAVSLISPHAGYRFSGQIAGYAYKQIEGSDFDIVAVVSPMHHMYLGPFAVTSKAYYGTPLGVIPLDADLVDAIDSAVGLQRVGQDKEHSLEIQLPFLQVVLGEFKLLPIMMGDHDLSSCQKLGTALAKVLKGKNVLLVASTDLSHFHSYETALRLDRIVLDHIEAFDPEGLAWDLETRKCEACGGGPVVTTMLAARELGANKARVIRYANSGDVWFDRSSVVGYVAAALYRARA